jgi:hypothetical protein
MPTFYQKIMSIAQEKKEKTLGEDLVDVLSEVCGDLEEQKVSIQIAEKARIAYLKVDAKLAVDKENLFTALYIFSHPVEAFRQMGLQMDVRPRPPATSG